MVLNMVKIDFSFNFRLSYLYGVIFLNNLVIFKHFLDLYLGYVASQSVFLYMKS